MGSLQRHQRSLIGHLNEAFQDLAEETDRRNAQIQKLKQETEELKKRRETDELRIQDLQAEIAQLQSAKTPATEGEAELEQKLQLLERTYEPQRASNDARKESNIDQSFQCLESYYRDLYKETVTLTRVSITLRNQAKHYKARLAQWQRWSAGPLVSKSSPGLTNGGAVGSAVTKIVPQADETRGIRANEQNLPAHRGYLPAVTNTGGAKLNSSRELSDQVLRTPLASTPPSARFRDDTNNFDLDSTATNPSSTASVSSVHEESECRPKAEDGDQDIIRIKEEPLSPGSLQGSSSVQGMQPSGSQDLDEVGDAVTTPRSRKFAVFEDEISRSQPNEQTSRSSQRGARRVFQPKNSNQINRSMQPRESSFKRRKTGDSGASAISSVSEDGDEAYRRFSGRDTRHQLETPCKGSTRNPEAHQRLDDLLSARPQRHSSALDPSLVRTPGHKSLTGAHQTAQGAIEPLTKRKSESSATKRRSPYESNPGSGEEDWNTIMQSVPFRELPVDCLDLSCFKPNPARNHGLDYAFNEVVRNHEQRKCIPGCMRADCCGEKFRAMVRAGGFRYEEGKHRALLEEFLGDQKHTLEALAEDDLNNLLVEAKARQLANQFGKHRHAYERARSPPGFWRTDMPSTQELAKDRIEADRIEREKVLDRVREALRPDGLWRFADEA